jgi:hypothetical protein
MPCRSGPVLDSFRLFRTYLIATAFCLSVEALGWNHVKCDLQMQVSFFTELIFDDFEAYYACIARMLIMPVLPVEVALF